MYIIKKLMNIFFSTIVLWGTFTVGDAHAFAEGPSLETIVKDPVYQGYAPTSSVIDQHEWEQLHMDEVLARYDRCITKMGSYGLWVQSYPKNNIDMLRNHQEVLQTLIEDNTRYNDLKNHLMNISRYQDDLLNYYAADKSYNNNVNSFYFKMNVLNTSAACLEFATITPMLFQSGELIMALLLNGIINEAIVSYKNLNDPYIILRGIKRSYSDVIDNNDMRQFHTKNNSLYRDTILADVKGNPMSDAYREKFFNHVFRSYFYSGYTLGDRLFIVKQYLSRNKSLINCCAIAVPFLYTIFKNYQFFKQVQVPYTELKNAILSLEKLRIHLRNIGLLFKRGEQLYQWAIQQPVLKDLPATSIMASMYDSKIVNQRIQEIYKEVTSWTVTIDSKVLYSRGKVLLAHKKLMENKDALLPFLMAIGEFDAYYSLVTLYKEYEHTNTPFSLPIFTEKPTTALAITAGWYPLIKAGANVVSNSLLSSDSGQRAFIITGPNACGKSLFVKMVGLTALLAQSWGIVPAQSLMIAPFDKIKTSFIAEEDARKELSTFASENISMERLADVALKPGVRSLLLIDEPYRGTVQKITVNCILDFLNRVVIPTDRCVAILATHVQEPTYLAMQYPSIIFNYHMLIDFTSDPIVRTFTLENGPALWWFNDTVKQKRYMEWFKNYFKNK